MAAVADRAVLLFAGGSGPKKGAKNQQAGNSSGGNSPAETAAGNSVFLQQYGQGCKDQDVSFTSAPMKMNKLSYIRPLGAVSDGHATPTDHMYIGGLNPNSSDNTYQVLIPADGTTTQILAMPASASATGRINKLLPKPTNARPASSACATTKQQMIYCRDHS